jgi:hypothetical protein
MERSGVTCEGRGARSVPAGGLGPPAGHGDARPPGPVVEPDPRLPTKGSEVRVTRCPVHGIAYDGEREICPECAKGEARGEATSRAGAS